MTKPKSKTVDQDDLARVIGLFGDYPEPNLDLLHRLERDEGMKVKEARGVTTIDALGLKASGKVPVQTVLANWGNLARRTLRSAGRKV